MPPPQRGPNPRRARCTWCTAPTGNACRDHRGRDLTWYHQPRITAAEQLPPPEAHHGTNHPDVRPNPTRTDQPDPRLLPGPAHPDPSALPADAARLRPTATRQGQRTRQPRQPATEPHRPRTRHTACADWLTHQLTHLGGTAPAHDLIHAARIAGYSRTTLHRARARLHITTTKPGYQLGWYWNLPPTTLEPSIPTTALDALTQAGQMALNINTRARAHRGRT